MPAPSADDVKSYLAFADTLADAARAAILPHFRAELEIEDKGGRRGYDPVTQADRAAEQSIRRLIEAHFPDHGVIGEEFPETRAASGFTWIVDPIDGTRAFIAGLPLWGVLIALAYEGAPLIGIIDQPYLGERFRGWPGGADLVAARGARPLKSRACASLTDAILTTTDPRILAPPEYAAFEQVRAAARLTRYGYDCYAYAMVAHGGVDLVAETGLAPWDVAALVPVVTGAGGQITDWSGRALTPAFFTDASARAQIIAAGDPRPRDEALIALRRAAK